MRRSSCPSQQLKLNIISGSNLNDQSSDKSQANSNDIVISRQPMFKFLEVPETLCKQFRIPSGCRVTSQYDIYLINFFFDF